MKTTEDYRGFMWAPESSYRRHPFIIQNTKRQAETKQETHISFLSVSCFVSACLFVFWNMNVIYIYIYIYIFFFFLLLAQFSFKMSLCDKYFLSFYNIILLNQFALIWHLLNPITFTIFVSFLFTAPLYFPVRFGEDWIERVNDEMK